MDGVRRTSTSAQTYVNNQEEEQNRLHNNITDDTGQPF